jgi:ATP-binding cassette subfamily F protein uup
MLAQVLARPSNLLILDEPTNDLDMETLEVLEEMLGEYPGTVLLISHDRDFLDRLVNGVIAPEGNGRWVEYAGGYSDMLAQRGADLTRDPRKPETVLKVSREPTATLEAAESKRRMTFKDKHALETLPATIAALQAEANALQTKLGDPQFYARDRAAFEKASGELGELQRKIAAAEEQWLALEMLREEIAGG